MTCACMGNLDVIALANIGGFEHVHTGGNCCALKRGPFYILANDGSNQAPDYLTTPCVLVYDEGTDSGKDAVDILDGATLAECITTAKL